MATAWGPNKGLQEFIQLPDELGDSYQVVLVGLSKEQIKELPGNVIGIERTNNAQELAGLYSMADVFVNAGQQETMGLTTVEAMACGTPAAVSNLTAVPEVVDENSGVVFTEYTVKAIADKVREAVAADFPNTRKTALKYEKSQQYQKYISLYEKMINEGRV